MDNQPAAKKSTVLKTEDDASSSLKRGGVSGDAEKIKDAEDQDFFTPALMDVWPKVLDYVTDSKDVWSAMNASAVFYSLLEKRKASALLPLVFPILINQNADSFAQRDVFNCRLVSKRMRTGVDNFLINNEHYRNVFLREGSYALYIGGVSQALLSVTPGMNWNPFVARYCALVLKENDHSNEFEVLQRYGHELHKVYLQLGSYGTPGVAWRTPAREMNIVKQALHCLPNLRSLDLELPLMTVEDVEEWKNLRTPAHYLPAMNSLTKLKLMSSTSYDHVSPPPSFRPILLTYRNQLTSLHCEWFVFCDSSWTSISFPHLLHLKVLFHSFFIPESSKWIKNFAKFHCPQLCSLTFPVNGLGTEMFLALNNFRSSLKKLNLNLGAALQLFQVDPLDAREFPLLTCLILSPKDTATPYRHRHLFRNMFLKLEELKFQYASNNQRVPDESVRSGYFTMFPDLKRITWTRMEFRAGVPLYMETVFRRQSYN